jgi:membrane dipeptidase
MRIADPNQLPEITDKLMDRGWAEADIRKLLGGNFLRVATAVWK